LQVFDWLCVKGKETFLFNEECGRANLQFVLSRCNMALSQFRAPVVDKLKDREEEKNDKVYKNGVLISNENKVRSAKEQRELKEKEE